MLPAPGAWPFGRIKSGAIMLGVGSIIAAVFAAAFIWAGIFDVAATSKHSGPVALTLHYAMERSVVFHAPHREPPDLDNENMIRRGASHYASGCAPCHGAPGELASPIAQQMTPTPPGLYSVGRDFTPSQIFWIVKHGVKMTAMPAWPAQQRDDEIWAMVAFLKHLPEFNTERYAKASGWHGEADFLRDARPVAPGAAFDPGPCARCHGANGNGRGGLSPKIAGMNEARIVEALQGYRDGSKASGFMQPVAAALSDEQMKLAGRYYAALTTGASLR